MLRGTIYAFQSRRIDYDTIELRPSTRFVRTFDADTEDEFKRQAKGEYDGAELLEFGPIAPPWKKLYGRTS